ncbi:MAG: HEAT repeat domain-containing protein [Planctomycetota bacterium]
MFPFNRQNLLRLSLFALCAGCIVIGAAAEKKGSPAVPPDPATAAFYDALLLESGYGRLGAAMEAYEGFLEKFPASPHCAVARFRIGVCLKRMGKYEDAIRAFEQALKRYPENTGIVNRARREIATVSRLLLTPEQKKHLDALTAEVKTADSTRRINIAGELARMKVTAALPALCAMLNDEDIKVRLEALGGILETGSRSALPKLREHAGDPISPKFRYEVKRAITRLELLTPSEMMSLLYSSDPARRALGRRSLPEYKKSPLVDMLVERLGENLGEEDKVLTLSYLGFTGDRRKRPICAEYMKADGSELVRLSAAYSVALLGGKKEALPILRRALQSADEALQALAANCLVLLSAADGCPVLLGNLGSPSLSLRRKAVESLRLYSGKSFGYDPEADENSRRKAIEKWRGWWEKRKKTTNPEKQGG